MKDLNTIKKELKALQKNFNPQKATYKIIEELTEKNYSLDQMINILSKIKGINKYPIEIKNKFFIILDNLKNLKKEEISKEEERRLIEKQKQEANTKELKDIIDTLEKELNKPKKEKKLQEEKANDDIPIKKESKLEKKAKPKDKESKNPQTIFKILLFSVIITLIIIILLIFFY